MAGCTGGAITRGGFGITVGIEHAGAPCGTAGEPCRIAELGTDVLPATTDFMLGQAGCDLVLAVRTAPGPTPGGGDPGVDRSVGLLTCTVAGTFCFNDTALRNYTITATVDGTDGARVVSCLDGPCFTVAQIPGVNPPGVALPWNPADSLVFGDAPGPGGRTLTTARIWSAVVVLPNSVGQIQPVPASAAPGISRCGEVAEDVTDDQRARTIAVLGILHALGAGPSAMGYDACAQALDTMQAAAPDWQDPLAGMLAGAVGWSGAAVPHTRDQSVKHPASEVGFIVMLSIGCAAGVALAVGGLVALWYYCGRKPGRRSRYSR
jgi:hypothetical protein